MAVTFGENLSKDAESADVDLELPAFDAQAEHFPKTGDTGDILR